MQKIDNQIIKADNTGGYTGVLKEDRAAAAKEVDMLQSEVDRTVDIHSKSIKAQVQTQKEAHEKATTQNKAFWTKQKDDATKALDSIASAQKKLMDVFGIKPRFSPGKSTPNL